MSLCLQESSSCRKPRLSIVHCCLLHRLAIFCRPLPWARTYCWVLPLRARHRRCFILGLGGVRYEGGRGCSIPLSITLFFFFCPTHPPALPSLLPPPPPPTPHPPSISSAATSRHWFIHWDVCCPIPVMLSSSMFFVVVVVGVIVAAASAASPLQCLAATVFNKKK